MWLFVNSVFTAWRCIPSLTVSSHTSIIRRAIDWSRSTLCAPAIQHVFSWWPSTSIWIHSHPVACCFWFLLLLVLGTTFQCATWVILAAATLAVSRSTYWCPHCCCVSLDYAIDKASVVRLDLDLLTTCRDICGAMIWCFGKGSDDDK